MDLGKMLEEAIETSFEGSGQVIPYKPHHLVVRGAFDAVAASETFLAKVREAENIAREVHEGMVWWNTPASVRLDQADGRVDFVYDTGIHVDTAHHVTQKWPALPRYVVTVLSKNKRSP